MPHRRRYAFATPSAVSAVTRRFVTKCLLLVGVFPIRYAEARQRHGIVRWSTPNHDVFVFDLDSRVSSDHTRKLPSSCDVLEIMGFGCL